MKGKRRNSGKRRLAACPCVAVAILSVLALLPSYGGGAERLIDTCWMWGHETGQVDGAPKNHWNLPPATNDYPMVDGCASFGVKNLCCIRWDRPGKAFRDTLAGMRQVSFPASSCEGTEKGFLKLADWCFETAKEMPNMTAIDFDDFFRPVDAPQPAALPLERLREIRRRADAFGRKIELRVVMYDEMFLPGSVRRYRTDAEHGRVLRPYLDQFDAVSYWTWHAAHLKYLPENFAKIRKLTRGKRLLMGVYLWDFGPSKPMRVEPLAGQLAFALEKWKSHEIDGLIFLCSSICNRDFPTVAYARQWLRDHCNDERDAR